MTDSTSDVQPERESTVEADREATSGMPRWVKMSLIIAAVLVAVFVVLQLAGVGGDHGPGRHMSPGHRPPAGTTDDGR